MESSAVIERVTSVASTVAARLKTLGAPVWKALTFNPAHEAVAPASCLCITIEKGTIAAVHASRALSHYKIKGYKRYKFAEGHYPKPEEVASTAALAFKDLGIRKTDAVLTIPKPWVVVKAAELPSAAAANLPEVISYELDRFTPFSAAEAFYDYLVLREEKERLSLLIAAVKADLMNPYLAALRESGISVKGITFDLSGISSLYRYMTGSDGFVFMTVNEEGVSGGVVDNGALSAVFSNGFTQDDDHHRVAVIENHIASHAAPLKGEGASHKVYISFRGKTSALKEMVRQKSRYPIGIADEMDKKISGITDFKDVAPAVIGGAMDHLWPDAKGFNLLSKGVREKAKTPFWLTIVLALALLALVTTYLVIPLNIENQRLMEIDRQIASRKGEVRNVEKLKTEIAALEDELVTVENFKNNRPLFINMLKELTVILPTNSWLTRLRISESQINIEGYAPSATPLISKLEASKYFRKVEFASPTFRDARQNMDRFQIKMEMEGIKDEKK
ncbi:MAG: PilN domain-containing protein [Nitrospirota bacterium]